MNLALRLVIVGLTAAVGRSLNIILTNDDGFETDLIQSLFFALEKAGHNVIMSAPYDGQSGTSGVIEFLRPLPPTSKASPGGTIPAGSPAVGPTTLSDNQFYVAGAVTSAVCYGIDVLAPRIFGQAPDLVLSGPNEGQNTGLLTPHSGTVGAAVTAINKGIPAIALSADTEEKNPDLVAELTVRLVETVYESIPEGHGLNVNFPNTTEGATIDDFEYMMTKIGINGLVGLLFYEDISTCPFALGFGITVPLPGMCLASPITSAGYASDVDPNSEFNVIAEKPSTVSVSLIEGTFQGPRDIAIDLEPDLPPMTDSLNIVLTNDDGFETALIQALYSALLAAGHNVVMSAPYDGQSGTSGLIEFLRPLSPTSKASPGGTIPAGSPAVGPTTLSDNQFYVAGAVTSAVCYGIDVLAPRIFGQAPDLVLSGPNEGQNTGLLTPHSGTVGAAVTAINKGIPAIALSADTEEKNPDLVAELTVKLIKNVYGSIPSGHGLNVNFPALPANATINDFMFVNSKIGINGLVGLLFYEDISTCPFALGFGITVPLPGMCLAAPITSAGYPEDSNPESEYNIINGNSFNVAVSVIGGTYQADGEMDITLPVPSAPSSTPFVTSSPTAAEIKTAAPVNASDAFRLATGLFLFLASAVALAL